MGKKTKINPVKDRTKGIGGSDVAAILGVSRYSSPYTVYLEKTGQVKPQEDIVEMLDENETRFDAMGWGNRLESPVAVYFTEVTGIKTRRWNKRIHHKEYDYMNANVDRMIVGEPAGLEIKTSTAYKLNDFEENIPIEYQCQIQHYMAVTGYDKWYFCVLIGGNSFRWRPVKRDNDFIDNILIPKCKEFWFDYVLARKEPPVTSLDHDVIAPYGSEQTEIFLPLEIEDHVNQFLSYKKLEREVKEKINLHKAYIKKGLLDGKGNFACTEKAKITYKTQERSTVDTQKLKKEHPDVYENCKKVSTSNVFNVKELKK